MEAHGDWFSARPRERILCRLLIALRVPPSLLAALGPRNDRGRSFGARFARWQELRRGSSRDEWTRVTRGIPVLMYHAFGDEPDRYIVSRRAFARQLRLLSLLRCDVLSFGELAAAIASGRPLPARTVVLTIDDGYADSGEVAVSEIERHGFGATIFIVTGRLGGVNEWSQSEPLRGRKLLSRDELPELRQRGVELGAHTRSHADLTGLDDAALAEEVASSRNDLEAVLGKPVRAFAYPYGRVDDRIADAVRAAGFESACTVVSRPASLADDALRVPRIEIRGSDSLLRFLVTVAGGWA